MSVVGWLRNKSVTLSFQVLSVTDWIGRQLHISSKWASRGGFLVLWGVGMTFIQVDEFFLALISWILSAIILFSKAVHWQGILSKPRLTQGLRILYVILAVLFIPVSVIWTQSKRGERPWTAFQWPSPRIVAKIQRKESPIPQFSKGPDVMPAPRPPPSATSQPAPKRKTEIEHWTLSQASVPPVPTEQIGNTTTATARSKSSSPKHDKTENSAEKPPTLRDLFNKDFANIGGVSDNGFDLRSPDGETIHISWRILLDFPGKNEFVAFYVPSAEHEFESCVTLAGAVQPMISDLPKRIGFTGGDSGGVTSLQELTFSGRVFIYHEWPLSNKQKADVIETYSAKGLDVQFRGLEYLQNRLSDWRKEHSVKEGR